MSRKGYFFFFSLLAAFITLSACDDDKAKDLCEGVICESGEVCKEGICANPCKDVSCLDSEVCVLGECKDKQTELCKDKTCLENEICVLGSCQPNVTDPCADVTCGPEQICVDGNCQDKAEECNTTNCPNGECVNGECVTPTDPCDGILCDPGHTCVKGNCEKDNSNDPCLNVTCGPNEICQIGNCYDKTTYPCLGVVCESDETCVKGECINDYQPQDLDEPAGNVTPNWDFEEWSGSMPTEWTMAGAAFESSVEKNTTTPKSRLAAANIKNPASSNARLESDPLELPDGKYLCSAWAKGAGILTLGARLSDTDDYSKGTYKYANPITLYDQAGYKEYPFNFNVTSVITKVSVLVAVKSTTGEGVTVDAISCVRQDTLCDDVTCNEWETCKLADGKCYPLTNRCNVKEDCAEWQACDANHNCVLDTNRCISSLDCPEMNKCDTTTKTCVAGDPCESITCDEWKICQQGACILGENRCVTSKDCLKDLPACDVTTHKCEAATHAANIFPNGGFEAWEEVEIPYFPGAHLLPVSWYGLTFGTGSDAEKYDTEIAPAAIKQYTTSVHSGSSALQIIFTGAVAKRFTTEGFNIPAGGKYTCSFWVRGKGTYNYRSYSSGGESPANQFTPIDTLEWQRVPFTIPTNVREYRLTLYVSNSDVAKDHVQFDDFVCTKD